ncbi:MAG: GNAT family N-acetyltransferase [Hyphomicrobiales bacterium]|nr:GNAT family N-acetyltransferase [Hyphomicrobiales bacterium]
MLPLAAPHEVGVQMGKPSIGALSDHASLGAAADLLHSFFQESGFPGDRDSISANLKSMLADPRNWAAAAYESGRMIGVVTVTTMLYVEWGRLGEVGDLYVVPEARNRGIARELVQAALAWCSDHGCSAVSVVVTERGEKEDGLGRFYDRLGFAPTGRRIYSRLLKK